MANVARFNTLDTTLDDLMRGFFVRPMNYEPTAAPAQLRVDVTENEAGYVTTSTWASKATRSKSVPK